jgi:hypothetical protein
VVMILRVLPNIKEKKLTTTFNISVKRFSKTKMSYNFLKGSPVLCNVHNPYIRIADTPKYFP